MRYLHRFTLIAWEANAMLDQGETLDIEETREKIHDGSLVDWFAMTFGDQIDMSLYNEEDRDETARVLAEIDGGVDVRRKFGVEHGGLQLIVALCLQAIQGGEESYAQDSSEAT
jgi:hypothetical protein